MEAVCGSETKMTFEAELSKIETWLGGAAPSVYQEVLKTYGGKCFRDVVLIYAPTDVIERNETFQTKEYCPGFITIGDDSGGRAIVISISESESRVFVADHGYMDPEYFEAAGSNLLNWIADGCQLPA